ncbi:DUF6221 family protein [Streptomyces sp. NPDC002132]|uniref:DUF6221 family protein n=1 Tax=unclassified Streptomyces TaxID=2593676 RepID=UPI003333FA2C
MDELVRWLGVQLDEDERIARAAGGSWRELSGNWVAVAAEPSPEPAHRVALVLVTEERAHIVRHDPARVLREVDAKRRILGEVVPEIDGMESRIDGEWGAGDPTERESSRLLRLLALPYADRPGYREEWRP